MITINNCSLILPICALSKQKIVFCKKFSPEVKALTLLRSILIDMDLQKATQQTDLRVSEALKQDSDSSRRRRSAGTDCRVTEEKGRSFAIIK